MVNKSKERTIDTSILFGLEDLIWRKRNLRNRRETLDEKHSDRFELSIEKLHFLFCPIVEERSVTSLNGRNDFSGENFFIEKIEKKSRLIKNVFP